MNYVIRILAIYLILANLFSSIYAASLLNLLLGGNNPAPEQGLNLSFGIFDNNNNQEIQNDYPDYNIGTSRDSTYNRPSSFQQQNIFPDGTRNFDQKPQDYYQDEHSGSQEYSKEPPNNEEEQRMGSPEAGTSTINQNIPRQQTNGGKNYKEPTTGTPKIISAPPKMPLKVKKTSSSQNPTINNVQEKNNLSNSDIDSGEVFSLKLNDSNIETQNASDNLLKEVTKNNINIKSNGEGKNVGKTKEKNVLKPIIKRKFFFQVKPVLPNTDTSTDTDTIFYVD